jgi:hypothetical protein
MTAFLRRATSDLLMWLGLDSATVRGFGLGRPGTEWRTWSLRTRLVPAVSRSVRQAPARLLAPVARVCGR